MKITTHKTLGLMAIIAAVALSGCTVRKTEGDAPMLVATVSQPAAELSDCVADQLQMTWPGASVNQRRDGSMRVVMQGQGFVYGSATVKPVTDKSSSFEFRFNTWGADHTLAPIKTNCLKGA